MLKINEDYLDQLLNIINKGQKIVISEIFILPGVMQHPLITAQSLSLHFLLGSNLVYLHFIKYQNNKD